MASSAPFPPATSFPSWSRACSGWNTAAMTPAAWRSTPAACSARAAPPAWPSCWRRSQAEQARRAAPASPTPAGPPTARRRCTTPIRISATARATMRQRGRGAIALVHNGIIENHDELRAALQAKGYVFTQPDRHRGDRPPGRQPVRRRPVRSGEGGRRRSCTAPTRSRCSARTSRTAWSARAPARR